jgi:hypothetical protein
MLGHSIVSQHIMEPEGSVPNSQELSTCSYPEPDQSSPHHLLSTDHTALYLHWYPNSKATSERLLLCVTENWDSPRRCRAPADQFVAATQQSHRVSNASYEL